MVTTLSKLEVAILSAIRALIPLAGAAVVEFVANYEQVHQGPAVHMLAVAVGIIVKFLSAWATAKSVNVA